MNPRRPVRPRRHALDDDRGQVGGIEALPFGVLVFVVGTLLVANAWAVVDAKLAADAAARQATRSFVEADVVAADDYADARAGANDTGYRALEAHGRDRGRATVDLTALESPAGDAAFVRCARATFTATYQVPAVALPWIGGFGSGFAISSTHSELVDPYRDGVPGTAEACG
ncbi:MAG: hypothetical protein ACRDZN_05435 [Acidimicrobiales bacterium]